MYVSLLQPRGGRRRVRGRGVGDVHARRDQKSSPDLWGHVFLGRCVTGWPLPALASCTVPGPPPAPPSCPFLLHVAVRVGSCGPRPRPPSRVAVGLGCCCQCVGPYAPPPPPPAREHTAAAAPLPLRVPRSAVCGDDAWRWRAGMVPGVPVGEREVPAHPPRAALRAICCLHGSVRTCLGGSWAPSRTNVCHQSMRMTYARCTGWMLGYGGAGAGGAATTRATSSFAQPRSCRGSAAVTQRCEVSLAQCAFAFDTVAAFRSSCRGSLHLHGLSGSHLSTGGSLALVVTSLTTRDGVAGVAACVASRR